VSKKLDQTLPNLIICLHSSLKFYDQSFLTISINTKASAALPGTHLGLASGVFCTEDRTVKRLSASGAIWMLDHTATSISFSMNLTKRFMPPKRWSQQRGVQGRSDAPAALGRCNLRYVPAQIPILSPPRAVADALALGDAFYTRTTHEIPDGGGCIEGEVLIHPPVGPLLSRKSWSDTLGVQAVKWKKRP
jgi:hypothetical protein